MITSKTISCFLACFMIVTCSEAQIKRIWLTHKTNDPSHIVVNWESSSPGFSEVHFRAGKGKKEHIILKEKSTLHHVQIPLDKKDVTYEYQVNTGDEWSETCHFKSYPANRGELRAAIMGNYGFSKEADLSQIVKDDPHIVFTLGDNIPNLHDFCDDENKNCIEPFLQMIDAAPDFFRTFPFMPILGNHDKEIRERGSKYPPLPVYDIEANAYLTFFELPDGEWYWHFCISEFDVCFVALDLNHVSDFGTTWQSCHDFHPASEQMKWYREVLKNLQDCEIITLQNEKNQTMRNQADGKWSRLFRQGSAVISGYGYFSERAEERGLPYFTTSLKAGDHYPDEFSKAFYPDPGYILFRKNKGVSTIKMKSLEGKILDEYVFPSR